MSQSPAGTFLGVGSRRVRTLEEVGLLLGHLRERAADWQEVDRKRGVMGGKSQVGRSNHSPIVASSWTPHALNCCWGSWGPPGASPAPDLTVFHWVSQVSVCHTPLRGVVLYPWLCFTPPGETTPLLPEPRHSAS